MQVLAAVFLLVVAAIANVNAGVVSVVPATTLVRTPSLDSAVIHSDRVGGSFAYSTAENHAYAAVSPVVQNIVAPVAPVAPVALTYSAHHVAVPTYAHTALAAPISYEPTVVVAK